MQDLKFLPLTQEAVEQKVTAFRTYTDEIRRSLPDVLLAMMTLLLNQYRAKYVLSYFCSICVDGQRLQNTTTANAYAILFYLLSGYAWKPVGFLQLLCPTNSVIAPNEDW